jgi:hypothetical protein
MSEIEFDQIWAWIQENAFGKHYIKSSVSALLSIVNKIQGYLDSDQLEYLHKANLYWAGKLPEDERALALQYCWNRFLASGEIDTKSKSAWSLMCKLLVPLSERPTDNAAVLELALEAVINIAGENQLDTFFDELVKHFHIPLDKLT